MILFVMAMPCEAKPVISYYQLKRDNAYPRFLVYRNEGVILIVSGIGLTRSAAMVSYIIGSLGNRDSLVVVNLGICGTCNYNLPIGSIVLANKITPMAKRRSVYPDILFTHDWTEVELVSSDHVVSREAAETLGFPHNVCFDMEAFGIFEACALFIPLHLIICIKIVSDHLEGAFISKQQISALVHARIEEINKTLTVVLSTQRGGNNALTQNEMCLIDEISQNIKLSKCMHQELIKLAGYYKLKKGDLLPMLRLMGGMEAAHKREGKGLFEIIRQKLIT